MICKYGGHGCNVAMADQILTFAMAAIVSFWKAYEAVSLWKSESSQNLRQHIF
jgi:hypothetical protein